MLANDRDRLSWGYVVARRPILFAGDTVEVFFDDLLAPGKSVAAAHYSASASFGCASASFGQRCSANCLRRLSCALVICFSNASGTLKSRPHCEQTATAGTGPSHFVTRMVRAIFAC